MARYKFRLKTILHLRESHRDTQREEVADALRAAETLREQKIQIEKEIQEIIVQRREWASKAPLQVARLLDLQRYETSLRAKLRAIEENQKSVEIEIIRRREVLVTAEREVKTLEKLDDRGQERHRQEEQRRETLLMDEFASQQNARQQQRANAGK